MFLLEPVPPPANAKTPGTGCFVSTWTTVPLMVAQRASAKSWVSGPAGISISARAAAGTVDRALVLARRE